MSPFVILAESHPTIVTVMTRHHSHGVANSTAVLYRTSSTEFCRDLCLAKTRFQLYSLYYVSHQSVDFFKWNSIHFLMTLLLLFDNLFLSLINEVVCVFFHWNFLISSFLLLLQVFFFSNFSNNKGKNVPNGSFHRLLTCLNLSAQSFPFFSASLDNLFLLLSKVNSSTLSYSEGHFFSLKDSGPLVILLLSCICDILTPSLTAVINLLGYFPPKSTILIYTYFQSWLHVTAPFLEIFYLVISQMPTVPLIQGTIINIINILCANLKSPVVYSLKVCVCLCLCVVCVSMCVYVWHVCVLCYVCGGQRKTFRS